MLKLTYSKKIDKHQTVTVIGDPEGIRDLYWQLTNNYKPQDGMAIGSIKITNLDGEECTKEIFTRPYAWDTNMSRLF